MTHFEDVGSLLDAPPEIVWRYLVSDAHGPAHRDHARNFRVPAAAGGAGTVAAERLLDGQWRPFVSRSTDFPPVCVVNEELEGEFAGTKFALVYRPAGERTRVDVYGDVRSAVFPADVAREKFLLLLAGAYEDDVAGLRRYVAAGAGDPGPPAAP